MINNSSAKCQYEAAVNTEMTVEAFWNLPTRTRDTVEDLLLFYGECVVWYETDAVYVDGCNGYHVIPLGCSMIPVFAPDYKPIGRLTRERLPEMWAHCSGRGPTGGAAKAAPFVSKCTSNKPKNDCSDLEKVIMSDYIEYIYRSLSETEDSEPCEHCNYRESCWKTVDRVIDAAVQGQQDDNRFLAAEGYIDHLRDRLCPAGKDSLIQKMMVAMYIMNNPPLFVPHMECDDNAY